MNRNFTISVLFLLAVCLSCARTSNKNSPSATSENSNNSNTKLAGDASEREQAEAQQRDDILSLENEARGELEKTWKAIYVKCGDSYYWHYQVLGTDSVFIYEGKGEPILSVDGTYNPPRELSEADKLNHVDPQPVEWQGKGTVNFKLGRVYSCKACAANNNWKDGLMALNVNLAKEHDKWKLTKGNHVDYYFATKCSDVVK
jgi:hypothetical protein